ncbi:hypothetical protein FRC03_006351 [Tulasnella sp. 419]|nr:hypothetical protein FRC03_006351 [Tulasnella sp. 419]
MVSSKPKKSVLKEVDNPPSSAFAEPSEPSGHAPEQNPKEQITNAQEENPQVIAHKPGKQAHDKKAHKSKSHPMDDELDPQFGPPPSKAKL